MKIHLGLALVALGLPAIGGAQPASALLLENVRLVDLVAGRTDAPRQLLVVGDRIVSAGAETPRDLPAGTRRIDAAGLYAMPGLVDAHAHLSYWGADALDRLTGWGITTVREMGGDPDEIAGWMRQIEAGERPGPTIYWSGPFLEGPEGGDEFRWKVASPAEAREAAGRLLDRGVDFLKIQPRIGAAEVAALVEVAADRGSYLVGHVPEDLSAIEAAELGLRSIEHLSPYLELTDDQLRRTIDSLLQREVWVSPALFSMVALAEEAGRDPATDPTLRRAFALVRRFHEAGVPLLVGSNFAYREWPHRPGSALHGEMEAMVAAGVPVADVLRATTEGNTRFLRGETAIARVTAGAPADLLLLAADPLVAIDHTRRVAGLVLRGRYLDPERLDELRQPAED